MSTKISWTNETWNTITGCTKVSEGCKNCYAEAFHKRLTSMGSKKYLHPFSLVVPHESALNDPLKWKKPRRIFVNSMSDTFHEKVPFGFVDRIMYRIAKTPQHTYQILTKRTKRMYEYLKYFEEHYKLGSVYQHDETYLTYHNFRQRYKNLWLGTTIENQKAAEERIKWLLKTPVKVKYLSVEPLLEPIDFSKVDSEMAEHRRNREFDRKIKVLELINWIIIGAESGPERRECKIEWIENIIDQADRFNIPVFVKQISINGKVEKDVSKFPKHLQRQEFPEI